MSETMIAIFNIGTMLCLLGCASYLTGILAEQKIQLLKVVLYCIIKRNCDALYNLKSKWGYLLFYIIIPCLIGHVLMLARQFRIGKMYIRMDLSFILGFLLWVTFPLFLVWALNKLKEQENNKK